MAKPLTKLVRFLFNKMGYDFLRLQKTHVHPEALSGQGRGGNFEAFEAVVPREIKAFDIYLRSCARVDVFGQERTRFNGAPKSEVILRCVNSVVRSISAAIDNGVTVPLSLSIIDDHSDADFLERLAALLATCRCEAKIVPLQGTGVGASLLETYELAREKSRDVAYFAADDYLHELVAVQEIIESFARLSAVMNSEIALFPSDYPDCYRHVQPCMVMLGSHRHWRTVPSTTGADVISIATLEKYWDIYKAFTNYGIDPDITEANTIDRVYAQIPCFSPLASLSVHFQHFETLSPYFDWKKWWEESAVSP